MRILIIILVCSFGLFGQGIEPTSLQPTPYENGILRGVLPYADPFTGDTMYIYQHDSLGIVGNDSLYLSNDTIFLRDGSGFVVIPENITPDSIYLSNDTIFLRDGSGFAVMSGGGTVKGTGISPRIAFWATSDSLTHSENLSWDAATNRLNLKSANSSINIGTLAGNINQGVDCINIGVTAGDLQTATTSRNINIGRQAGRQNQGNHNVNIGDAINSASGSTGSSNVYIGRVVGAGSGSHFENVGLGYFALHKVTNGNRNVANGSYSLNNITTGSQNLGLGFFAGSGITTGNTNVAIGDYALAFGTGTRIRNVGIGSYSLANATGEGNVGIGVNAGRYQGAFSVAIGQNALADSTAIGGSNVGIGFSAGFFETGSNRLYIENTNSATPLIGGYFDTDRVGINTDIASIARTLHVTGEVRITDLITDTPTRIVGADADGDLGEIIIGSGLTLTGSTLSAASGSGDDWGTQVVQSDITLLGDGTAGNLLKVDTTILATQHDLTNINTDNQNLSHTVSGTDRTINISGGTGTTISVADNDNDSTNELQTISKSGSTVTLSNGGGSFTDEVNDADSDPTNELQTISTSGAAGNITLSNGGGTLNLNVNDADSDPNNELNTGVTVVHAAGNVLPRVRVTDAGGTLEGLVPFFSTSNLNAGVVTGSNGASNSNFLRADGQWAVPTGGTTYTAGTGISISGNVITNTGDLSNTNELITNVSGGLSGSAGYNISVTEAGVTRTALVPVFFGASAGANGNQGLVPVPLIANRLMFLRGDGTWANPQLGMQSFSLGINNGSYTSVVDGQDVTFNAGTNVSLSKSGSTITINSTGGSTPETFIDWSSTEVASWFSTGTFNSGKRVGLGILNPSRQLDANGDVRFRGAIYNSANSAGTAGQVLTSQGSGAWTWTTPSAGSTQNLSYGTKSGNRIPLDISSGVGVNVDENDGIQIQRTASNVITFLQYSGHSKMFATSAQTITSTATNVSFSSSLSSLKKGYFGHNAANNRFDINTNGVYKITFRAANIYGTDARIVVYEIMRNGSRACTTCFAKVTKEANASENVNITEHIELTSGDQLTVRVYYETTYGSGTNIFMEDPSFQITRLH